MAHPDRKMAGRLLNADGAGVSGLGCMSPLTRGALECDESVLTGESAGVEKSRIAVPGGSALPGLSGSAIGRIWKAFKLKAHRTQSFTSVRRKAPHRQRRTEGRPTDRATAWFSDGTEVPADVAGRDVLSGLAVLKARRTVCRGWWSIGDRPGCGSVSLWWRSATRWAWRSA